MSSEGRESPVHESVVRSPWSVAKTGSSVSDYGLRTTDYGRIGLCAHLACVWEVTARKPGNVHRYADFADLTYLDFVLSAAAVAPVLDSAPHRPVGATVLQAIQATRQLVATNTNLGIVLLLAPLAAVPPETDLRGGLRCVLNSLDVADARAVYEAIRLAAAGGMGRVGEQDIGSEPTEGLREVMTRAAGRDLIARQYADGFREVFDEVVPAVQHGLERTGFVETAIIYAHLRMLALHSDSLIARKRGLAEAGEASCKARDVLGQGWPDTAPGKAALVDFDRWLRAEGHSRNPGTTADLVTAGLFVLLREGTIPFPLHYRWSLHTI